MPRPRGPAVAETPRKITGRSAGCNGDPESFGCVRCAWHGLLFKKRWGAANLIRSWPARRATARRAGGTNLVAARPRAPRQRGQHRAFARHGEQSLFRAFARVAGFPAFPNTPHESSHVSRHEAHAVGAHHEGTMSCLGHVEHRPKPFTRSPKLIPKMTPGPSCGPNSRSGAARSRVLEFIGEVNSAACARPK
jgi:hypothetical protein